MTNKNTITEANRFLEVEDRLEEGLNAEVIAEMKKAYETLVRGIKYLIKRNTDSQFTQIISKMEDSVAVIKDSFSKMGQKFPDVVND